MVGVVCCYRQRKAKPTRTKQVLTCNVPYGNIRPSWRMQANGGHTTSPQAMRPNGLPQYIANSQWYYDNHKL